MRRIIFTVLTILWMAVIFWFSANPADESAKMSHSVGEVIGHYFVDGYDDWPEDRQTEYADRIDYPVRKCAHAMEYAVLGFLLVAALCDDVRSARKRILLCILLGALYACSDEFHQLFVSGRSGQISDVMLDSCGVVVGTVVGWMVLYLYGKIRNIWEIFMKRKN